VSLLHSMAIQVIYEISCQ